MAALGALCAALAPIQYAFAWDGVVSGAIHQLDAVASSGGAPGAYDFRVYLVGNPNMCSGGGTNPGWAYINSNDANFKGVVSILELAFATGKSATIYSNLVSGQCQIGYVAIS